MIIIVIIVISIAVMSNIIFKIDYDKTIIYLFEFLLHNVYNLLFYISFA